ncbi:MAG TPA: acyl-CoA dehydrogenase family protein [Pseudomonadales bacterium]|nr:acyl-CoA dehydrogenase family protein [Pseudomonadales bacterium]
MDLRYSDEELAFRDEVRRFFAEEYPQDILARRRRGQTLGKADLQRSEKALAARGWAAVNWPEEYGGTGWNVTEKYLFDEALEQAGAPSVVPMGLLYVAPVIYTFGTAAQKQRFLPDILESNVFWAQGYSEPGSGSDLASLQCRAERTVGDDGEEHYVLNGTKVWTSQAHFADWIFCLVRTSDEERKQQGITFLTIDMSSPGVSVHPIITIDGGHHLNSVTFEDVRVPLDNRIGEEGMGWTYAKYLLTHERTSYAHIAGKKAQMQSLREIMAQPAAHGPALADDPDFRRRYDEVMVQLTTLEFTTLRTLAAVATGGAPGNESSILKIRATEVAQAITELYLEAAGYCGLRRVEDRSAPDWNEANEGEFAPAWTVTGTADYFFTRAQSIYGGTNEIQKNVIAKQVFGL